MKSCRRIVGGAAVDGFGKGQEKDLDNRHEVKISYGQLFPCGGKVQDEGGQLDHTTTIDANQEVVDDSNFCFQQVGCSEAGVGNDT